MSINLTVFRRAALASLGAVALLAANAAAADDYRNRGWRGGKKVVVVHKSVRPAHVTRRVEVVHVHRSRPAPRRTVKIVKVVKHRYVPAPPRRYRPANVYISNRTGGLLIGALLGAVTGSQIGKGSGRTAAVITGTVLGAVIGGEVGRSMDRPDRYRVQHTLETVPTGHASSWVNPDSGANYTVTPTRTYRTANNRDCRDYTAWAFIGGYEQQVIGTACRRPDGSWQTVQG